MINVIRMTIMSTQKQYLFFKFSGTSNCPSRRTLASDPKTGCQSSLRFTTATLAESRWLSNSWRRITNVSTKCKWLGGITMTCLSIPSLQVSQYERFAELDKRNRRSLHNQGTGRAGKFLKLHPSQHLQYLKFWETMFSIGKQPQLIASPCILL